MAPKSALELNNSVSESSTRKEQDSIAGSSDVSKNAPERRRFQSMEERSRIPPSTFVIASVTFGYQYWGGVYSLEVLQSWKQSMLTSYGTALSSFSHLRDLMQGAWQGEFQEARVYVNAALITIFVGSILHVLIWSPLRAGMWTNPARASRHVLHRYMGLLYLVQYAAAWIELVTNYDQSKDSYLPHFVALNGLIQGLSAYFSFKVLPNLEDPGYYSDNGGRIIEFFFVFGPYLFIRPWFPHTQFSKAGTSKSGRTDRNERFYQIGTTMVKIFYLWAKYFCGFYINYLVYLGLQTEADMKFIRGLFLLNAGTVSIAVFLHTLRFKKVLPPKLAFSIYLAQIYATFSAIPLAFDMFAAHKRLCAACLLGILCNMTRSRPVHAVWCTVMFFLLTQTDIEW